MIKYTYEKDVTEEGFKQVFHSLKHPRSEKEVYEFFCEIWEINDDGGNVTLYVAQSEKDMKKYRNTVAFKIRAF
jgi:hypothetical protein